MSPPPEHLLLQPFERTLAQPILYASLRPWWRPVP